MRRLPIKTLTDQQRYLLGRIPQAYNLRSLDEPIEPAKVRKARALIAGYDAARGLLICKHKKRMEALINKAREAVYFEPIEKALVIVRQVEKETAPKCP